MGSVSDFDIETLKKSVQGEVIVKGECSREEYQEAIKRWNQVFTKDAVRHPNTVGRSADLIGKISGHCCIR